MALLLVGVRTLLFLREWRHQRCLLRLQRCQRTTSTELVVVVVRSVAVVGGFGLVHTLPLTSRFDVWSDARWTSTPFTRSLGSTLPPGRTLLQPGQGWPCRRSTPPLLQAVLSVLVVVVVVSELLEAARPVQVPPQDFQDCTVLVQQCLVCS